MISREHAMPPRTETNHGSSARKRVVPPEEDALGQPSPPSDDTPTIISRHAPPQPGDDPTRSVRGRRLAHFELIEPIGVGGMAAVLRARDTQLDRLVALKILPPEMAADVENVRRFHQEARSAAKLDHENIARVFYCGEDQRLHFIAFEFVEGENLRTLLERRGRLPVGEALHYMIQVAAGLMHAAERGVVHRDIKPSNIIITPAGRAKLVDMGLARSLTRKGDDDLTQSGVTLGTFDYISPEQALEPRDADTRSDIYSLGCTFYHALTGRPPVPEGTAAKKLHHHQHVKPADPRDHVGTLPAEVVMVLDRMMAKGPDERFQTADELMQALLAVARKLGVVDVPDGLAVEASLPGPAPFRPLLWIALAGILVVALVLLADAAGPTSRRPPARPARPDEKGPPEPRAKDAGPGRGAEERTPVAPPGEAGKAARFVVDRDTTAADLLKWLEANRGAPRLEIVLRADLDLTGKSSEEKEEGLQALAKQQIILRSAGPNAPHTIRRKYHSGRLADDKVLNVLTLRAPRVTVEGVRFLIDGNGADVQMRALHLPSRGHHTVKSCLFVQARPQKGTLVPNLASVHAGGDAELNLSECAFLGFGEAKEAKAGDYESFRLGDSSGLNAVLLTGPARLKAEQCAFGPHAVAFLLQEGTDKSQASLNHCTALLPGRSALFSVDGPARLKLSHSLVARLPGRASEEAVLLRDSSGRRRPGEVRWDGEDNAYHDLDGYWVRDNKWKKAGWAQFRNEPNATDDSRLLLSSPWREKPQQQIAGLEGWPLDQERPDQAFAVKDARALRVGGKSARELVGARALPGALLVPDKLLPLADLKADGGKRVLVVEPGTDDFPANGIFGTLRQAVDKARPGDIVAIRHDGELSGQPVLLGRKELADLTIRPARGFRPTLALKEAEACLFRLHDGRLRLEGLEFRLELPADAEAAPGPQSVVALAGNGECFLKGCTVTLVKNGEGSLSVAFLPPPWKGTRMPAEPLRKSMGPRLSLLNCFIRGEGDVVCSRAARPAQVELEYTVVALSGSVYAAEYPGGDTPPPPAQKFTLRTERTTTYLGGALVRLKPEKGAKATVPVECKAENSLFVPAREAKYLIQLEAPDGESAMLQKRFQWSGTKNAYGEYQSLLAKPGGADTMPALMGVEAWKRAGDEQGTFSVKVDKWPDKKQPFHAMTRAQFPPPEGTSDVGAPYAEPTPP